MTSSRYFLLLLLAITACPLGAAEGDTKVDPWEPMNRKIFAFNETLDDYVLLPVAKGYRKVVPDPAERGVSNFISNVYEFNTIFNSLLQGEPGKAGKSVARFVVNTTVGLAGLLDVATEMGIKQTPADFDQTLYVWGVDSGPYLMLPLFGPSTVRSGVGRFVDSYSSIPSLYMDQDWSLVFYAVEAVDVRANLIKADDLITGDRYIFIRNAYLQRREHFLTGKTQDSFYMDDDEEYIDF